MSMMRHDLQNLVRLIVSNKYFNGYFSDDHIDTFISQIPPLFHMLLLYDCLYDDCLYVYFNAYHQVLCDFVNRTAFSLPVYTLD